MVYGYYGNGQGKTSTLNGLCLRVLNHNKPILFIRFFKGCSTSEDISLEKLGVKINSFQTTKHFIWTKNEIEKKKIIFDAKYALNYLLDNYLKYDYLFLDEIIDLVTNKIMTSQEFCDLIEKISEQRVIFISGHYMDDNIKNVCDVLTEFTKNKHHYDKGINAIKFIDF